MAIGLLYGGTGADILLQDANADDVPEFASATYTAWTTRTGSTQITELYTYPGGALTSTVSVQTATGDDGRILFYSNDAYSGPIWLRNEAHTSYTRWLTLPWETLANSTGVTDHGALTGLNPDDDHPQYFNTTRGDARYYTKTQEDAQQVRLTGAQTIAGVKTFSSAPVIPDGSLTIAKTSNLQAAINTIPTTMASLTDTDVPVDDGVYVYDTSTSSHVSTDLTDRFAGVGADGRLAEVDWPAYFVPQIVLNEGQAVPAAFPANGLVWTLPAPTTLAIDNVGGSAASAASATTFNLATNLAVGDYLVLGIVASAEAGLTSFTAAVTGGGITLTEAQPHTQGTVVSSRIFYGRATSSIASNTVVSVTHAGGVRSDIVVRGGRVSGLVSSNALDLTSTGGAGAAQNFSTNPTATATSQANEVAFGVFGWNPNGLTYAPGANWSVLGSISQTADTSPRACVLQYRVLATGAIVTSTGTTTPTGAAATSAHSGVLATFRAA